MPPIILESFMNYMIESSIGQAKIRELKEQFKGLSNLPYTIVDYINSMDYVIRKLEVNINEEK